MTIKFKYDRYFDLDEHIYTGSDSSFNIDDFQSDPDGLLDEIVKDAKDFFSLCNKKEYYDKDYWTKLNTKFSPIILKIKTTLSENNVPSEYYESEIRPRLKQMSQYASYLRDIHKENTKLWDLAESFNPIPKNEVYTKWILNEIKSTRMQETDKETSLKYVQLYDSIKDPNKKSIKEFDTFTLRNYLEELGLIEDTHSGANKRQKAYLDGKMQDCKIIYSGTVNDKTWVVYEITSVAAAMAIASNTEWCTRFENHAKNYLSKPCKNLIAFYKNKKPYAQLCLSTGEFRDKKDITISSSSSPPYRLQDEELYKVLKEIKNPNFSEVPFWNYNDVPFKDLVLPAYEPTEGLLESLSKYQTKQIHAQLIKELVLKRYKALEPQIFYEDAPYMLTEPYMSSWAQSDEGRDEKIEKIIYTKPNWALSYSSHVIKGAWPEAETAIFKAEEWDDYIRYSIKKTTDEYILSKFLLIKDNSYKEFTSIDEIKNIYNQVLEFSCRLKPYQRKDMSSTDYVFNIIFSKKLTNFILFNFIENHTNPEKYLDIVKSNETDEIESLKIKDSVPGEFKNRDLEINDLTKKLYKELLLNLDKTTIIDGLPPLRSFIKKFLSLKNNLTSESVKLINTYERDANYESKFIYDYSGNLENLFDNENYYSSARGWRQFVRVLYSIEEEDSSGWRSQSTSVSSVKLNDIFKDFDRSLVSENSSAIYPDQDITNLYIKYFIYSSFYSQATLIKIFNYIKSPSSDRRRYTTPKERRAYIPLLIEKAVINKEKTPLFWNNELFHLLNSTTGRGVILSRKSQRDTEYVKDLINDFPEYSIEIKTLLDSNYKVTRNVSKKNLDALTFVEILNVIDNLKVPSIDIVKEAFKRDSLENNQKIAMSFCEKKSLLISNLISKFYDKNIGFIELFDLLKQEEILSKFQAPTVFSREYYYNPILISISNYSYFNRETSDFSGIGTFLSKIKDIPDFKIWLGKYELELDKNAQEKGNEEAKKIINSQKNISSEAIDRAIEDLPNYQFNLSQDVNLTIPGTDLILSTPSLSSQQLQLLQLSCPGIFILYINLYNFSGSTKETVDKLILQLIKQAAVFSKRLSTYSDQRKLIPGRIIEMFLPYLAKHHFDEKDSYLEKVKDALFFQYDGERYNTPLSQYTTREAFKARLIRDIKRFNK